MSNIYLELNNLRDLNKAKKLSGFFKTGKGEYGEGDKFLGISVPNIRRICSNYPVGDLVEIEKMLKNEFHEIRFAALICLRNIYKKTDKKGKRKVFNFYLKKAKLVNNWDLVDSSAPYIVGDYILNKKDEREILCKLCESNNLWERRISVVSNLPLIKVGYFDYIEKISLKLLKDNEDLIHKSVGWMLREVGKVDEDFLLGFLDKYSNKMPRTMLRYSIERLNKTTRLKYLL